MLQPVVCHTALAVGRGALATLPEPAMNIPHRALLAVAALVCATQAQAQITLYENDGLRGRSVTLNNGSPNLASRGFNDRASSVVVTSERWEVCESAAYRGRCTVLRPGQYASLSAMGLNDRVSSVRSVSRRASVADERYAPQPVAAEPDYRRRRDERVYQARVTSVRAVVGPPEQRCWTERQQVVQERGDNRVPGALAGALIGGILGHQIGGGRGKDLATVGGVVAGAALGSQAGRDRGGPQVSTQDVRRCATVPGRHDTDYWDVTYNYRGEEHRVQMTSPPGRTISVNRRGEPRV